LKRKIRMIPPSNPVNGSQSIDGLGSAPHDPNALHVDLVSDYEASFHMDGSSYNFSYRGGVANLQGSSALGLPFDLRLEGQSRVELMQQNPDGTRQRQEFSFHEDALFGLPNGDVVALNSINGRNGLALMNPELSAALVLKNTSADGSPGMQLSQHRLEPGGALQFLNQEFGRPGHPFIAQQYRLGPWDDPRGSPDGLAHKNWRSHRDAAYSLHCAGLWGCSGSGLDSMMDSCKTMSGRQSECARWVQGPNGPGVFIPWPSDMGMRGSGMEGLLGECPERWLYPRMSPENAAQIMGHLMQERGQYRLTREQLVDCMDSMDPALRLAAISLFSNPLIRQQLHRDHHMPGESYITRDSLWQLGWEDSQDPDDGGVWGMGPVAY
jgi:hypothetical protein